MLMLTACGEKRGYELALPVSECQARLAAYGATFNALGPVGSGACTVKGPVSLVALEGARLEPRTTAACPLALALARFDAEVVQPYARRRYGMGVRAIHHYGSHACRTIRGSRRMSLHAQALAFDIAAFELEDGRMVRVSEDYRDWWGRNKAFLRDVAEGACARFNLVLTPDDNRDHRDHLHVDLGPYEHCGADEGWWLL